jgi:hypothetical protein|tara:strand:- start:515 stop:637 length:123 start_codon:yes stop_codon:yes gene_type:complete
MIPQRKAKYDHHQQFVDAETHGARALDYELQQATYFGFGS